MRIPLDGKFLKFIRARNTIPARAQIIACEDGAPLRCQLFFRGDPVQGVRAQREDMNLSCDRLLAAGQEHWQASGSVHMAKAGRTFTGPLVDYYPAQDDHIVASSGGTITSPDGTLSADHLEGWLKQSRFTGIGNAHVTSPARDLEGGGDRMDYYGNDPRPYVELDGNAWVYQGNNTARSNHMTVYLADDGTAVTQ